ncbi:hypothetical protein P4C99_02430 [Pontiellaceae bacterium B1224]|nr:hypothetical protein [Pontiellaceae bacterium B1224]
MKKSEYNPKLRHPPSPGLRRTGRRSIRLKGHDYAGGGLYFVTLCAHREFISAGKGCPFGENGPPFGATCVSPVRGIIAEEWRRCGEVRDDVFPGEFVVMPDHFHGLIRIVKGATCVSPVQSELGHVIGAFKAAVSRRIRRGDTPVAHTPVAPDIRIWHRNYYEMIVRSAEAEQKIAAYIRMNPWKCVQAFEGGFRGIGNPALWNAEKLGVLCSRNAPHIGHIPNAEVYFGGWHSPKEKEILAWLLGKKRRVIACFAWDIESAATAVPGLADALEENRMLMLEMRNRDGDLAAAEQRNRFVIKHSDTLFVPYTTPGGMLDRLLKETRKSK